MYRRKASVEKIIGSMIYLILMVYPSLCVWSPLLYGLLSSCVGVVVSQRFILADMDVLPFHLQRERGIMYGDEQIETTFPPTKFSGWMDCNRENPEARNLLYTEFPSRWVWDVKTKKWRRRRKGFRTGVIPNLPPAAGELYYLSLLLHVVRGPVCYQDLRTVYGIVYPTFAGACLALGLVHRI